MRRVSYSNAPLVCRCERPNPIRTEVGVRCFVCAKRLPEQEDASVLRSKALRTSRDKTAPKKYLS